MERLLRETLSGLHCRNISHVTYYTVLGTSDTGCVGLQYLTLIFKAYYGDKRVDCDYEIMFSFKLFYLLINSLYIKYYF
jgi:hypothetical protein